MTPDELLFSRRCPQPWFGPDDWVEGDNPLECVREQNELIRRWLEERQRRIAAMGALRRFWYRVFADPETMPPEPKRKP